MVEPHITALAAEALPSPPGGDANVHRSCAQSDVEETFVFPASLEQTRYWMLAQLDPASTASNMAISFDIEGEIDDRAAEAAISALTLRHEALRTVFRLEGGFLSQVVLTCPLYGFSVEDLRGLPEAERETAAAQTVGRHGHTRIDLHAGPVLHARLIHLSDRRHIMALTMNHIVCDGWSNGILIRDFTVYYEAIRAQREPALPELPFQFADFSLWQEEYLESPAAQEAAAFWKAHITAELPALDMPTDHPRTSGRSFPGHIESALIPREIDERLKQYCRSSGSTKHIVLLAAFQALCARYTGQTEFLLGSTIANRTQPGMEDVVGRFANPQIIVAKVAGDPTFAALERRVRDWETAAYNHQDLPFSRIIEEFQIGQAGATSQFLQVWFLYQKAFMQPQAGETIRVTPRRSVSGGVDFDLLVSVVERAEGPRVQIEYNTELFKPERVRDLIASFIELLGAALRDPARPISQLAAAAAMPAIVAKPTIASMMASAQPDPMELFERVRARAEQTPDDFAVAGETHNLTWRQLEERSSAVAAELHRRGGGEAAILAVHLAPRHESLIALLAALKAGVRSGARVLPLPGHATATGTAALLEKLPGRPMLLAARDFSASLPALFPFEEFAGLPPADERIEDPQPHRPVKLLWLTDAQQALFESQELSSVVRTLDAVAAACGGMTGSAAMLVFPADTPAEACLDLLLALAKGAQCSFALDPRKSSLQSQLARQQVTHLVLSARDLKLLVASGWEGDRRVSLVLRGGRLPAALQAREARRQAGSALLPRYLRSAVYLLSAPQASGYAAFQPLSPVASVGRPSRGGLLPLLDKTLAVIGPNGETLPSGAFGELHAIAPDGHRVPLGCMARSALSGAVELLDACERFLPLRGHRICLGDIEDALYSQAELADSLAAVTEVVGTQHLVVYLRAAEAAGARDSRSAAESGKAVRRHLAATLPSHLVPSEYIWLDRLPLSLDGRVDLTHLPCTEAAHCAARFEDGSPELTAIEQKLLAIWRDVLGLRHVEIHQPFFELGGSSLLLVRLFARINKAFDTSLPITTIFDAQTIAGLARTLGGSMAEISPLVQVQPRGSKTPVFMVHSYLLYKGLSSELGDDQPFYGLRELDRDGGLSIEERVKRYVEEIRRIQPAGPYRLAGWCAAGPLTVELARQLLQNGQQVSYLALFDSWLPGYIESIESAAPKKGPLPFDVVWSKLAFHRAKMRGLAPEKKLRYLWLAATRLVKEAQYNLYLRNWARLRRLSEKYRFTLPQFMHNTSLDTFSALKDYRERCLPVHMTLIRASDSREVPGASPSCGWERVAEHGVEVLWAPGDHESMFVGDNLKATAALMASGLASAGARPASMPQDAATSEISHRGAALHVDCHGI